MRTYRNLVLAVAGLGLAACQDLEVANLNNPDRERALSQPDDVETLVASSWRNQWSTLNNTLVAYNTMPVVADELTATYANDGAFELSAEPRVALNNEPTSGTANVSRSPWEGFYRGISSVNDGLGAVADGLRIRTSITGEAGGTVGDNTTRLWAFGKLMSGILHGHIGMLFDKGFVVHHLRDLENVESIPLVPYQQVQDSAIAYILEAIDTMRARPFSLPPHWIPDRVRTSDDLIRIGHSYIAQIMVYGARTPEERAATDWARVIQHIDQGIQSDYEIDLSPTTGGLGIFHNVIARAQQGLTGTFSSSGDYKLIGPADVSGRYAAWLAAPLAERDWFDIVTPDRRITGATPTATGQYFRYRTVNIFDPTRGLYNKSRYQAFRKQGGSSAGVWYLLTKDEMNLMKAEALYHLNRRDEAAALVNISRTRQRVVGTTTFPGLPPVTANGVPQSADCVPRMDGVTCANLIDAIQYERMVEGLLLTGYRAYMDSRGWGRLTPGTFLHMPIPGRELAALGMPLYSFGGVGGEGAAR